MTSLFKRVWALVSKPTRLVGRDLEGNAFFEYPSVSEDPRRTKRMVEYRPASAKWDYIGGNKRLPVQWTQWLTHTRPDPPTLEELQADIQRRYRVQQSAQLLEEGYKAERAANMLIPEPASQTHPQEDAQLHAVESQPADSKVNGVQDPSGASKDASPKKARMLTPPTNPLPPPETKPWSPKVASRG
ncbi:hypothetical protein M408DRAFT_333056 [Serendipita vermifera MAFF 305830]|uniref:NADH dehydrogenase [ubiquinone] 1 alpha subcomplex subunit n=1 Tax=Serendipita vermifera MAFF 305830 TaxID=933852 RepID=A0A0C3AQ44_SERVB|nr:hypothetical protein M408DRAFT_333056 [Serendipita vermifera MAFF 305830]